jgi:hypothetical protein
MAHSKADTPSQTGASASCHCFIRHAVTELERVQATAILAYARKVGDINGIAISMARLSGCPSFPSVNNSEQRSSQ